MGIGVALIGRVARKARGGLMLAVVALWLLAGAGRAQGQAVTGKIVTVGLGGADGKNGVYREGSWIPVQVLLQNKTGQPFVGHLAIDQDLIDLDGDKVLAMGPEFTLAPGAETRTLWTYYWPRPDYTSFNEGVSKVVVLDKSGNVVPGTALSTPNNLALAMDITPVDDNSSRRSTRFVVILGRNFGGWRSFEGMYGGTEAVKPIQIDSASQLPDRVLGYDGVDVIYWQMEGVKLADMSPPEFTLGPILSWVKAGGHLVISVGSPDQAQALSKADEKFKSILPLAITDTRDIRSADLGVFGYWGDSLRKSEAATLVQTIGTLKPGARVVVGDAPGSGLLFADHPLVVTGLYGQGAITMVTIDPSDKEYQQRLGEREWINFWNQALGWRQNGMSPIFNVNIASNVYTAVEFNKLEADAKARNPPESQDKVAQSPQTIRLGENLERDVDVKDVTQVRILVALLFLALYWLLAGPVGHLILRAYKVVHWSWWIFGGVVILATSVAGVVVLVLHVSNYDVRHQTFLLGTVTPEGAAPAEATVDGFYGIYAPVSGLVTVKQPDTPGMSYLVPLCLPSSSDVKSYADPQSYTLNVDQAGRFSPVFRNTLKKVQGRWNGPLPGISGAAEYVTASTDLRHVIAGTLTNRSGYDLVDADVLVYLPHIARNVNTGDMNDGCTYVFHLIGGTWKNAQAIDLTANLKLDELGGTAKKGNITGTVEMALEALGWLKAPVTNGINVLNTNRMDRNGQLGTIERLPWLNGPYAEHADLLYLLGDARNNDPLDKDDRRELSRGVGRLTDCTKALHAAGALIVAHAEDVKSPVTLNVNGHAVDGKGRVVFAWALPLAGSPPQQATSVTAPVGAGGTGTKPLIPDLKPEVP